MAFAASRKIDPSKATDKMSITAGLPSSVSYQARAEWREAGLIEPNCETIRDYRLDRLRVQIEIAGVGGLLMFDPMNIRYATDSTNMILWNHHNPFRAVLLCADGHLVLWDYRNTEFLTEDNPRIHERRTGADLFYFDRGNSVGNTAAQFGREVESLLTQHGEGSRVLAVDKIMVAGLRALESRQLTVIEGEPLTEFARSIKCEDEVKAMRCAMHSTEQAVARMREAIEPGMSEMDIWAVLHYESIKRGGEWIETRLLSSGPRTHPWFRECSHRIVQPNEIIAFDTDLIGPYGMCCDISRTWWIGDEDPPAALIDATRIAHDHLTHNMALLRPGRHFSDITEGLHLLPENCQKLKYGCAMHGVGLCDEWPLIAYPDQWVEGAFDSELKPGMVLCVEALVSPDNANFSIKLEDQVLITETGFENLTKAPFDPRLQGV